MFGLVGYNINSFNDKKIEVCKDLCLLLGPFLEVTKEISSEQYLHTSKVIPIKRELRNVIGRIELVFKNYKTKFISGKLRKGKDGLTYLKDNKEFVLCTFLDPTYKHHNDIPVA